MPVFDRQVDIHVKAAVTRVRETAPSPVSSDSRMLNAPNSSSASSHGVRSCRVSPELTGTKLCYSARDEERSLSKSRNIQSHYFYSLLYIIFAVYEETVFPWPQIYEANFSQHVPAAS